jgi:hypothetical protein
MRSIMILLIALGILLLPCQGFTQTRVSNNQAALQQGEKCFEGNVLVRIKLKNGEKVEGALLEKTTDEVKICRKSNTQLIATNDIEEIKTKMTGKQRFRHTFKVLGIAWGVSMLATLILYGSNK